MHLVKVINYIRRENIGNKYESDTCLDCSSRSHTLRKHTRHTPDNLSWKQVQNQYSDKQT